MVNDLYQTEYVRLQQYSYRRNNKNWFVSALETVIASCIASGHCHRYIHVCSPWQQKYKFEVKCLSISALLNKGVKVVVYAYTVKHN